MPLPPSRVSAPPPRLRVSSPPFPQTSSHRCCRSADRRDRFPKRYRYREERKASACKDVRYDDAALAERKGLVSEVLPHWSSPDRSPRSRLRSRPTPCARCLPPSECHSARACVSNTLLRWRQLRPRTVWKACAPSPRSDRRVFSAADLKRTGVRNVSQTAGGENLCGTKSSSAPARPVVRSQTVFRKTRMSKSCCWRPAAVTGTQRSISLAASGSCSVQVLTGASMRCPRRTSMIGRSGTPRARPWAVRHRSTR